MSGDDRPLTVPSQRWWDDGSPNPGVCDVSGQAGDTGTGPRTDGHVDDGAPLRMPAQSWWDDDADGTGPDGETTLEIHRADDIRPMGRHPGAGAADTVGRSRETRILAACLAYVALAIGLAAGAIAMVGHHTATQPAASHVTGPSQGSAAARRLDTALGKAGKAYRAMPEGAGKDRLGEAIARARKTLGHGGDMDAASRDLDTALAGKPSEPAPVAPHGDPPAASAPPPGQDGGVTPPAEGPVPQRTPAPPSSHAPAPAPAPTLPVPSGNGAVPAPAPTPTPAPTPAAPPGWSVPVPDDGDTGLPGADPGL